jgi:transcriptional regulator
MYIPSHFAADAEEILQNIQAADLVTLTDDGLVATYLPFVYDPEQKTLQGHVARNNAQWKQATRHEALVIVHGPSGYVTPSWYATKADHGRVVPTWNYLTAHVYGELVVHDDPEWLDSLVRRLTDKHERSREHPWSVDDAPAAYVAGQLRAIVGVELRISRVEAKAKFSQNRSAEDIDGVVAGLEGDGEHEHAQAVRAAR